MRITHKAQRVVLQVPPAVKRGIRAAAKRPGLTMVGYFQRLHFEAEEARESRALLREVERRLTRLEAENRQLRDEQNALLKGNNAPWSPLSQQRLATILSPEEIDQVLAPDQPQHVLLARSEAFHSLIFRWLDEGKLPRRLDPDPRRAVNTADVWEYAARAPQEDREAMRAVLLDPLGKEDDSDTREAQKPA